MISVPYFSDDFKLLIERNVSNWCFWISAFHKNVSSPLLHPLPSKISDWVLGTWPWRTLPGTQLPERLGRKFSLCCGHARRGADAGFQRSRAHPRESTRSRGSVNTGQGHAHLWRCFQGPRQTKFRAPVHCCELDCVVQQRNLSDGRTSEPRMCRREMGLLEGVPDSESRRFQLEDLKFMLCEVSPRTVPTLLSFVQSSRTVAR